MKFRNFLYIILAGASLIACSPAKMEMTISNKSNTSLFDKGIGYSRVLLEKQFGELPENKIPFLKDENNELIPCQVEDLDGNGTWDNLFTIINFEPNEIKTVELTFLNIDEAPAIKPRTNIRFADKNDKNKEFTENIRLKSNTTDISQKIFQMEGPAWENDVVAFRNYFDARNGNDIFGKVTSEMVMDICGLKDGPIYHNMQPWGMDILKVGNSLGAGAIALETTTGLHRIGPNCDGTYKLIKEGPLQSIFELKYENVKIDDQVGTVINKVSIQAGKPYFKSSVTVDGFDNAKLVTGIVNLHSEESYTGSTEDFSYMYTHDKQAYNEEMLGLAIITKQNTISTMATPEEGEGIVQTFYTTFDLSNQPVNYYFMAGWELQDKKWADKEAFEAGIVKEATELTASVTTSF